MAVRYVWTPPRARLEFTGYEIQRMAISVGALTLAFVIAQFRGNFLSQPFPLEPWIIGAVSLAAFVAVITGFLCHELAHKIVATRHGLWAMFDSQLAFVLLGPLLALAIGFPMAAPGYVEVGARGADRRKIGQMALAGPLLNLLIGGATFVGFQVLAPSVLAYDMVWVGFLVLLNTSFVNLFLGTINLIPIPPLDGEKVARWNVPVYLAVFVPTVMLLVFGFFFL